MPSYSPILSRHLDFFEMVRNEDDLELARRFDMVRILSGEVMVMGFQIAPQVLVMGSPMAESGF